MMFNVDKGFVELLNQRKGISMTWAEFLEIYRERKKQRDADPRIQARRALEREVTELMGEEFIKAHAGEFPPPGEGKGVIFEWDREAKRYRKVKDIL